jgi:hypothetical protein
MAAWATQLTFFIDQLVTALQAVTPMFACDLGPVCQRARVIISFGFF